MCAAMIKPSSKAQIEARNQHHHEKEIRSDIRKIDDALQNADPNVLKELHRYLDGKYQSCITGWGDSMYEYVVGHGFEYEYLGPHALRDNLTLMKPKLEAFLYGWNMNRSTGFSGSHFDGSHDVNVTVNNTVNISISFKEARKQVEDMSSLTDEQTREVLERIDEIEQVINTDTSKKSKWEQIKPVLKWLADKSYDLGKTILPLLLKIQE